jgi:hypothetical protein
MRAAKANIESKEFFNRIEPVQRELEAWRRTRKHRERIPETLWKSMARLAGSFGVSRVSHALGVEYPALKRRVYGASPVKAASLRPSFVEVKMAAPASLPGWVVELEKRSGEKMTLRLAQSAGADLMALVETFWRGRP